MRRSEREVTDPAQQLEILNRCKILRLAMQDAAGLYIVPLSFGYVHTGQGLSFYIHSAKEGRKVLAMTQGCAVAFELDCGMEVLPGQRPCSYSCRYQSLVGTGHAVPVTDPAEKAAALAAIMRQQTGQEFSFTEEMTQPVAIFRVDVENMTGKQRL